MRDEEEHRSVAKQSLDALLVLDPLGRKTSSSSSETQSMPVRKRDYRQKTCAKQKEILL